MKSFLIGDLNIPVPIIQGGMGVGISLANLASAVANEGGVGVISAAGTGMFQKRRNTDFLQANIESLVEEIRKAKRLTKGIIGVNIMVAMTGFADIVQAVIKEGIDIIFAGAGLPLDLPRHLEKTSKTKLIPIISSARAAKIIVQKWLKNFHYLPDGFVIEGPKAGGHLGFKMDQINDSNTQLDVILPEVIEALKPIERTHRKKIPLIAAGGIYDGEDIFKFIQLGAQGVQMATRFVATTECDASDAFKQAYLDAKAEDIRLITSPVGLPGRAIHNAFLKAVDLGDKHPFSCPFHCIVTCKKEDAPYCISLALYNAKLGKMTHGFAFAGSNVHRINRITSVKALFKELMEGYASCQVSSQTYKFFG